MRVTTKGQVTIPQNIRKRMHILPSTEINFIIGEDDRVYIIKAKNGTTARRFSKLRGIATVQMSTEEIMALTRADT